MTVILATLAALLCSTPTAMAEYSTGITPPDFSCSPTHPETFGPLWQLSDFRGKVVLVNFGTTW